MYHCERCGNDYQSQYFFAVEDVCNNCFQKMSPQEQQGLIEAKGIRDDAKEDSSYINKRIGFGLRLGAYLIDVLILSAIFMIIGYATGEINHVMDTFSDMIKNSGADPQDMRAEWMAALAPLTLKFTLISLTYYLSEIFFSASFGKYLLGIQIADANAEKAVYFKLGIRYLLKNASSIFSILYLLTSVMFLSSISSLLGLAFFVGCFLTLSQNKMALHDIIAKTAVYRREDLKKL